MLKRSKRLATSGYRVWSHFTRPVAGLVLTLGLTLAGASDLQVRAVELPSLSHPTSMPSAASNPSSVMNTLRMASSRAERSTTFPESGVYLYGEAPEPGQIGSAYAVIEVVGNTAIGAFYMPNSSFDCFHGEIQSEQLALNVMSTYDQDAYDYSIPLQTTATVASTSTPPTAMQLAGYHSIETISSNDYRILNTCRAAVQNR